MVIEKQALLIMVGFAVAVAVPSVLWWPDLLVVSLGTVGAAIVLASIWTLDGVLGYPGPFWRRVLDLWKEK